MKNEYRKDCDGSMEVEITVEGSILMYQPDGYDSQIISLKMEDWEEVKTFIDSQIAKMGVSKNLLGERGGE